jgi:hypothetical protein
MVRESFQTNLFQMSLVNRRGSAWLRRSRKFRQTVLELLSRNSYAHMNEACGLTRVSIAVLEQSSRVLLRLHSIRVAAPVPWHECQFTSCPLLLSSF